MRSVLYLLAWLLLARPAIGQVHLGPVAPRLRVLVDNNFSGDPGGLLQLAPAAFAFGRGAGHY
jgi:hypothetical protein